MGKCSDLKQENKQNKISAVSGYRNTRDHYRKKNLIISIAIIESKDFWFSKCWFFFFQNTFILVLQIFPLYCLSGSIYSKTEKHLSNFKNFASSPLSRSRKCPAFYNSGNGSCFQWFYSGSRVVLLCGDIKTIRISRKL